MGQLDYLCVVLDSAFNYFSPSTSQLIRWAWPGTAPPPRRLRRSPSRRGPRPAARTWPSAAACRWAVCECVLARLCWAWALHNQALPALLGLGLAGCEQAGRGALPPCRSHRTSAVCLGVHIGCLRPGRICAVSDSQRDAAAGPGTGRDTGRNTCDFAGAGAGALLGSGEGRHPSRTSESTVRVMRRPSIAAGMWLRVALTREPRGALAGAGPCGAVCARRGEAAGPGGGGATAVMRTREATQAPAA